MVFVINVLPVFSDGGCIQSCKVSDQLLLSFSSVSYYISDICDAFTVFLASESLLVLPVSLWWKYRNKKTLLVKTLKR